MPFTAPISPAYGSGQTVTAASAAANTAIQESARQVRVTNKGAGEAYVRTYNSRNGTVAATAADYLIMPGVQTNITKPLEHDRISYISADGATLNIIVGEGW